MSTPTEIEMITAHVKDECKELTGNFRTLLEQSLMKYETTPDMTKDELQAEFPQHSELIRRLTRST